MEGSTIANKDKVDEFWKDENKKAKLRKENDIDSIDTKAGHHSAKWEKKNKQSSTETGTGTEHVS